MIDTRIRSILENIPDKNENMSTTSKKMKEDIVNYIKERFENPNSIEFGTHRGQTTLVLAQICDKVYTINKTVESFTEAKQLHRQWNANNIEYIPFNLYSKNLLEINDTFDIAFIDAGHSYEEVAQDVRRCLTQLEWKTNEFTIIFDDFGMHKGVFNYVRKFLGTKYTNYTIMLMEYVGHEGPHDFGSGRELEKGAHEGIILKIVKTN
jgi:16S rRNA G966 N2-methylase RsmD